MSAKATLVLGGSSALGEELVGRLLNQNHKVAAHYFENADGLNQLKEKFPGQIFPIRADLNSVDDIKNLIKQVEEKMGCPEAIVHLASDRPEPLRFKEINWNTVETNINIQVRSVFDVLQHFLPTMSQRKSGKVVFALTSYVLGVPPTNLSHYVVAKYALLGLMKSLASEYASKSININSVSPSMIETQFLKKLPEKLVELNAAKMPLKRNAMVADVIPAIEFLLSPGANYMCGVNIPVSGGSSF